MYGYTRQPPPCTICWECGHRARESPLSGLCRRCRQPGHTARKCIRAWGSTESAQSADVNRAPVDADVPAAPEAPYVSEAMASDDVEVSVPSEPPPPPPLFSEDPPVQCSTSVLEPSSVPWVSSAPSSSVTSRLPRFSPYDDFCNRPDPSPAMLELRKLAPKVPRLHRVLSRIGHVIDDSVIKERDAVPGSIDFLTFLEDLSDQYSKQLSRVKRLSRPSRNKKD